MLFLFRGGKARCRYGRAFMPVSAAGGNRPVLQHGQTAAQTLFVLPSHPAPPAAEGGGRSPVKALLRVLPTRAEARAYYRLRRKWP